MIALASRLRLEELGFEVVGAVASGPDAIAQCERTNVDMVLMDVRLRGAMDGIEAARRIISRHAVSILFVSAYTSRPETLQRIQEIGDFPVLSKPYTDESFKDAVVHLAECEGGPGRPS